ncbi:hypothetical protein P152DRAFT_479814 [Eremomyces bilateralis CBS 781.70]|uniref:Glycogen debranching enzyme n=1 Tax=Eremomyces bilateralis CBS 781.70 TaxID=1392243 RepID=A0A6G1GD97_9PEZI|nr:uncharacterized protein P152DRAFT_479814 [Eremomyces bilateralis CBS 781.70]KAF1815982.1 hypothetical protein P152DRAFT_479814 [Eremomyces bilateralis CBS 781.70]
MASPQRVHCLNLKDDGSPNIGGTYICLPPPTTPAYHLRFSIQGTSSVCQRGSLWSNIPGIGETFQRDQFREFKLDPDFNRNIEIDFTITQPGSFSYYITYSPLPLFSLGPTEASKPARTPEYYIDVTPALTLRGNPLPLDSLSIISCLSKFMGQYPSDWQSHLGGISARGYNCVHFAPLMKRGESNSPYSMYDQLEFDPECFPHGEADIADLVKTMHDDNGLLTLCDIVWNHTANNSQWLEEHPEAGYNVVTAPHLESALELDNALLDYSKSLRSLGMPTELQTVDDLLSVMEGVKTYCISGIKLWEYYVLNRDRDADAVVNAWVSGKASISKSITSRPGYSQPELLKDQSLKCKADWLIDNCLEGSDRMGERFRRRINPQAGAFFLNALKGRYENGKSEAAAKEELLQVTDDVKLMVDEVNLQFYKEYDTDCAEIMEQLFNRTKYTRLDDHGPKLGPITRQNPLIEAYFTRLPLNETTKKHDLKSLALVNNGWIWAADALRDHAGPKSRAYLRREVIVWGDCVKLRYGSGPEDNPYLWDRMARYTRLMAKHFHAFRIDNCHSTPIHLASYMLDEARKVRENIAVFAELFSGSEQMDSLFVQRLNLNGLIREAMQAWSTQEMSRLVHRHNARPIGSFDVDDIVTNDRSNGLQNGTTSKRETVRTVRASTVHALFMDCTHDNEPPAEKRDARDTLPNAALVAMCACSTGSVMGYDEIYPALLNLVSETRLYGSPYSTKDAIANIKNVTDGIGACKAIFNTIHTLMGTEGYNESFIHHDQEYITVHRVKPQTREGYFLIAHTAYPGSSTNNGNLDPVRLPGTEAEIVGAWVLEVDSSAETRRTTQADTKVLRGLPSSVTEISDVKLEKDGYDCLIHLPPKFPPGSVALFKTKMPAASRALIVADVGPQTNLESYMTSDAAQAFGSLSLCELNVALYRCDAEERDLSDRSDGTYQIPEAGTLVYAGLQGWWSVLGPVVRDNNLGHPVCQHLREGDWAMDYIVSRFEKLSNQSGLQGLVSVAAWLKSRFAAIKELPMFLHPRYFAMVIRTAYHASIDRNISLLSRNIGDAQQFVKDLSLVSTQMTGLVNSASLWPNKAVPSMAAGLPHFACDWARCWGRDIFISMRGLYLSTGRFDDAKEHILAFASVVNHGMIPNLLSGGRLPRYNSRDSVWFFLQGIQDYCTLAPEGLGLLEVEVPRRFLPYDDTWFSHDDPRAYSTRSTVREVVQEIMQRHASGLHFREYNAGPDLDSQMTDAGFNIDIQVDWTNGMLFGGNQHNCGTWMDKMGESERAGSKGVPGTPRDGAAVEITGLLFSTLAWLTQLPAAKKLATNGVEKPDGSTVTWSEWAKLIKDNFERCYYVPSNESEDQGHDVEPELINRRGIYKDLYRSGKPYEDYQLRPNFPIAMVVAPDLFSVSHAISALHAGDQYLRGPLGMATLDPGDLNYRPYYVNSEDSDDFATSKGRNYHQGPEWVWPLGFFLRALLIFGLAEVDQVAAKENWSDERRREKHTEVFQQVHQRLKGCRAAIRDDGNWWKGLTELTQKGGELCPDSSPTQAWSAGCLLDLFQEARELGIDS